MAKPNSAYRPQCSHASPCGMTTTYGGAGKVSRFRPRDRCVPLHSFPRNLENVFSLCREDRQGGAPGGVSKVCRSRRRIPAWASRADFFSWGESFDYFSRNQRFQTIARCRREGLASHCKHLRAAASLRSLDLGLWRGFIFSRGVQQASAEKTPRNSGWGGVAMDWRAEVLRRSG
jgi:hypothetical protein